MLEAQGLSVGYDRQPVLRDLHLRIERGTVTTFLGANGCGKSTLLKAFGRVLKPQAGEVLLDGAPIRKEPNRQVARKLAILPQSPVAPAGTSVLDLVMRGRNPHQSWAKPWTAEDAAVAEDAIAATGLTEVAHRDVTSLSGGQRQRAWIAMVVAQQAETLLLDEPTTYLDLAHQLEVLRLVRRLNREQGSTIVMVLHDLSLAARYSDRLVVLHDGGVVADGTPHEVLTPALLEHAFGLHARVFPDPVTGAPMIVPEADEHDPLPERRNRAHRHTHENRTRAGECRKVRLASPNVKTSRRGHLRAALLTSVTVSALLLTGCSSTGNSNDSDSDGGTAASKAWSYQDATGATCQGRPHAEARRRAERHRPVVHRVRPEARRHLRAADHGEGRPVQGPRHRRHHPARHRLRRHRPGAARRAEARPRRDLGLPDRREGHARHQAARLRLQGQGAGEADQGDRAGRRGEVGRQGRGRHRGDREALRVARREGVDGRRRREALRHRRRRAREGLEGHGPVGRLDVRRR
ncbi:ABC transporter ATP-binding protein [Curtobacterium flaccumfaciens]|nr:ABC transporter ATP-binding protein [Curtobacterium flaccumfaciens]